jgi:hypothetical protein
VPPLAGPRLGEAERTATRRTAAWGSTSSAAPAAAPAVLGQGPSACSAGLAAAEPPTVQAASGRPHRLRHTCSGPPQHQRRHVAAFQRSAGRCSAATQALPTHSLPPGTHLAAAPVWPPGAPRPAPPRSASRAGATSSSPAGSSQVTTASRACTCCRPSQYTCAVQPHGPLRLSVPF